MAGSTKEKIYLELSRLTNIKNQINAALDQISVESDCWKENAIQDSFGQAKNIYTYLLIIPANEKGALERVIIDALNDIPEETALMGEVEQFIDALKAGLLPDLNQLFLPFQCLGEDKPL